MHQAFLIKGAFQDSVSLMLISKALSQRPEVNRVSIMMGTPANLSVFRETGMYHEVLDTATPQDMCVVIDAHAFDDNWEKTFRDLVSDSLKALANTHDDDSYPVVHTLRRALSLAPEATLAQISVAGHYAGKLAREALESGLHVMLFSDNVDLETEKSLKTYATQLDKIVMGPDCGTSSIAGAPLAFCQRVEAGPVGLIGASGTGLQELMSQLAQRDIGVSHALGLGGRDLSLEVGGLSAQTAIRWLNDDPNTDVVVFISKPPHPEVKAKILRQLAAMRQPTVALFLGEAPTKRVELGVHLAYTLDEAARLAAELVEIEKVVKGKHLGTITDNPDGTPPVMGLFSGGTLAAEMAMLLAAYRNEPLPHHHDHGFMLDDGFYRLIDLGDDEYTRGRPHPMIDPSVRTDRLALLPESTQAVLWDVVLGTGAADDPVGPMIETLEKVNATRKTPLIAMATLTGTLHDRQGLLEQKARLEAAGVIVMPSTRLLAMLINRLTRAQTDVTGDGPLLLQKAPTVINLGLKRFADDLHQAQQRVIHVQWAPACGGNPYYQHLLALMR